MYRPFALALFATAQLLGGCEPADEPNDQLGDDLPNIDEVDTRSISGVVTDFETGHALPGTQVCALGERTFRCTYADDSAIYELPGLPTETLMHVRYSADGHLPLRWALDTAVLDEPGDGLWFVKLPSDEMIWNAADALEIEIDPDKGIVLFRTVDEIVEGLEGASGELEQGDGVPFYFDQGEVDPDLAETGSAGFGGFMNVTPGNYQLEIDTPDGRICQGRWAWGVSPANALQAQVVAGEMTFVEMMCQ